MMLLFPMLLAANPHNSDVFSNASGD